MKLTGEQKLALPRDRVWQALNDPEMLKRCVPGCDTFEPIGDNRFNVGMAMAVGPVKARFTGKLTLSDIKPPTSYALTFEGSGGAAGFGKGSADVTLSDVEGGTLLSYGMEAQVGGKLAQVGGRLIDGVSRKLADEFFSRFAGAVQGGEDPAQAPAPAPTPAPATAPAGAPVHLPAAVAASAAGPGEGRSLSATIAVLGAAISAVAAAVAVLAAAIAIHGIH